MTEAETGRGQGSVWSWLPGVLISAVAVFFLLRAVDWPALSDALRKVSWGGIALAFVLSIGSVLARSLGWKVILGPGATLREAFFGVNEGYLFNNILPFRAGELARAYLVGRSTTLGGMHVLSSIVIERAYDLVITAGLLLGTLPLALGLAWARPVAIVVLGLVIAGLIALYLAARFRQSIGDWVARISEGRPFLQKNVQPHVKSLLEGLSVLTSPGLFVASLVCLILAWLIAGLSNYVVLRAVVPQAPLWWAALSLGMLGLGVALPAAPASIGVYEGALVASLTVVGVDANSGLAFALIVHFISIIGTAIFGAYGLFQEKISLQAVIPHLRRRA